MTDADLQKIADDLGEPIEIVRDLADAIACCAAEGADEARAERRGNALEAGLDVIPREYVRSEVAHGVEAAVEQATRVRVDADVTQAVREAHPEIMIKTTELKSMIEVALAAAGFEVEQ